MRRIKNVFFMFLILVAGCAAPASPESSGVLKGSPDIGLELRVNGDLGVEAILPESSRYDIVPVDDISTDAEGKVLVPQGSVEQMSDVQVMITLIRSYKIGEWMLFALLITQLLIRILKRKEFTQDLMPKYGTMIVLVLCAISAMLSALVGGMNPVEAVLIFVMTGLPKFGHDMRYEWNQANNKSSQGPTP